MESTSRGDVTYRHYRAEDDPEAFLRDVDVVVGILNPSLLKARANLAVERPFVLLLMGEVSNGVPYPPQIIELLRPYDVMGCSCRSDVRILTKFVGGLRSTNIAVIPNLIDIRPFQAGRLQAVSKRQDLFTISFAGRLTPQKNIETLLLLFRYVSQFDERARLVLAGPWDVTGAYQFGLSGHNYKEYISDLIIRYKLEPKVEVRERLDRDGMIDLYSASDVVANPSLLHDENFGVAQVEAMASGKPLVVSDWGGIKDTVEHECGYRMTSRLLRGGGAAVDWLGGANFILRLLDDYPLLNVVGEASSRHADEQYGFDCILSMVEKAARQAIYNTSCNGLSHGFSLTDLGSDMFRTVGFRSAYMTTMGQQATMGGRFYEEIFSEYVSDVDPYTEDSNSVIYERLPVWFRGDTAHTYEFLWRKEAVINTSQIRLVKSVSNPVPRDQCDLSDEELRELIELGFIGVAPALPNGRLL